jgi:ectoine hydroxylase-related dioxygenase (phytanoyl-CoA dioxygenase family)
VSTIYYNRNISDDERRELIYGGDLFVYEQTSGSRALAQLAREMTEAAFKPHDPVKAQYHYTVEEYAAILAEMKPGFIHHPEAKKCIQQIMKDLKCDPDQVHFDVPRMRTSTAQNYLTTGIAYAFHPHRDTWYSAPQCQINFWFPVYEIESENSMAFHPNYWDRPVRNGSRSYNYRLWNEQSRFNAAQHINKDTRVQPKPEEPMELEPQLRVICPPGGLLLFSAAQMHSSVPNSTTQTRISIDFRTVHEGDLRARRGAQNIDSESTGTTLGDYLRASDLKNLPADLMDEYDTPPNDLLESAG